MREVKNNRVYLDGLATAEYNCDKCGDDVSDVCEYDGEQFCSECYDKAQLMEEVTAILEGIVENYYGSDDFKDNYEEYVRDYRNYYVGSDSVGSVGFGEQEEEFPESLDKELFVEDDYKGDFCYNSGRFYYDMSSDGIHFVVSEDDAKIILAKLEEDAKEDAKWETGK